MPAEVRETSSTGGQKGVKLERYDLVPVMPLRQLAILYGLGARKYEEHNWRKGYEWGKSIASIMRHLEAYREGKNYDVCSNDPEECRFENLDGTPFVPIFEDTCFNHTGAHHLDAVAWHAFGLREMFETHPDHDDRYLRLSRKH